MQDLLVLSDVRQPPDCASKGLLDLMIAPEWLNKSHQLRCKLMGIVMIDYLDQGIYITKKKGSRFTMKDMSKGSICMVF